MSGKKGCDMKIVVIGGTGLIGSKLVNKLKHIGHEVLAASPSTGVNTVTGKGLAEALKTQTLLLMWQMLPHSKTRLL